MIDPKLLEQIVREVVQETLDPTPGPSGPGAGNTGRDARATEQPEPCDDHCTPPKRTLTASTERTGVSVVDSVVDKDGLLHLDRLGQLACGEPRADALAAGVHECLQRVDLEQGLVHALASSG